MVVSRGSFCGLPKLEELFLQFNSIETPPELLPVKSTLKKLFLNRNKITQFPQEYFKGFRALAVLSVAGNKLASLPDLFWMENSLMVVNICCNAITSLSGLTRQGRYTRLVYLDASENRIGQFCVSFLSNMPNLQEIRLHHNHIAYLEDFRLFYNGTIQLEYNMWHCGPDLEWMRLWALGSEGFKCDTPSCLHGRNVSSMSELASVKPLIKVAPSPKT